MGLPGPIEVQLAKPYRDWSHQGPRIAEPKLDGVRVAIHYRNGRAVGYSRGKNRTRNIEAALTEIERRVLASRFRNDDLLIDTEALIDGSWRLTSGLLRRQNINPEHEALLAKLKLHAFDIVTMQGTKRADPVEQRERNRALRSLLRGSRVVVPVPTRVVKTDAEARAFYQQMLKRGYEGIMLKTPEGIYVPGRRTTDWLKMKPKKTSDGIIVGFQAGKGKHKGRLGALVLKIKGGKQLKVGTGFTDAQRSRIWRNRNKLLGRHAEYTHQPDKVKVSSTARFPTFVRIRGDRDW